MIHVTVYNLSVALQTDETKLVELLEVFIHNFYTIKGQSFNGNTGAADKAYFSKLANMNVYYLHINQFRHLLHFLKERNFNLKDLVRDDKRCYEHANEDYEVRDGWTLHDYQKPVVDFIVKDPKGSKMISMQTGKGKSLVALYSLANVKMRMAVVILSGYIPKWQLDIAKTHNAKTEDIMVVQGSKSLKALIHMAKEGTLNCKYFMFSSSTMQQYISGYEANPLGSVETYGIHPIELFPLLKVGSLLVDETHQHFHAVFKILLHSNVKLQIGLSATLISDDSVVSNVHSVVYPKNTVYDAGELDKYADVYALSYYVPPNLFRGIKTTNYGSNSYSHTAFEQSIAKNLLALKFFCSLIDSTLRDFYIDKYEAKDKCLIFVATVNMATLLTKRYTEMYPDKLVNRYCEEDPFENILEGEIVVTTVISAGTAIDIPDLRTVIQTVSISSSVANIQTLGRLRKLKGNKDTRFCYIYAENLPKQKQYHYKRLELFRGRVASHQCFRARAS